MPDEAAVGVALGRVSQALPPGEIRALTGLRGVAACWVALHHICREAGFEAPVGQVVLLHGYLAVDLFFVLSGFVLSFAYADWFRGRWAFRSVPPFLARRLARIWPLHAAVVLLLMWAAVAVGGSVLPAPVVAANLALVQAWKLAGNINPSSWSLSAEFAAYLLFPFLVPVVFGSRSRSGAAAIAAALLLVVVVLTASSTIKRFGALDVPDQGSIDPVLRCLGGFVIGMTAYRVVSAPSWRRWLAKPGVALSAGCGIVLAVAVGVPDLALYPLFPLLVAALAVSCGRTARVLSSVPFHALGVLSFALYLVHVPVAQIAMVGLPHSFSVALALLALAMSVAILFHFAIERPGRWLCLSIAKHITIGKRFNCGHASERAVTAFPPSSNS